MEECKIDLQVWSESNEWLFDIDLRTEEKHLAVSNSVQQCPTVSPPEDEEEVEDDEEEKESIGHSSCSKTVV